MSFLQEDRCFYSRLNLLGVTQTVFFMVPEEFCGYTEPVGTPESSGLVDVRNGRMIIPMIQQLRVGLKVACGRQEES